MQLQVAEADVWEGVAGERHRRMSWQKKVHTFLNAQINLYTSSLSNSADWDMGMLRCQILICFEQIVGVLSEHFVFMQIHIWTHSHIHTWSERLSKWGV